MFFKPVLQSLFLFAFFVLISAFSVAAVIPEPPDISARSHLLIDLGSGQVLSEYQADESLPPASLTKLMTSYVLSYELNKDGVSDTDLVTVSENAWAKKFPGSSLMWIEVGTKVSIADLHRGVIISSGNDASVAVAEHLAGSQDAFAEVMNKHAEELGMHGSHFVNAHGLPDPNHFMTARDLATLSGAMISRFPEQYKIYSEREFTYNNITQQNRNKLLWRDNSVDGLKTGHTNEAGYCMVASGKRDDMRLISVVLGTKTIEARNREAQKLLAYGFRYFDTHKVLSANDSVASVQVWEGETDQLGLGVDADILLTIPKGRHADLQLLQEIEQELVAPIMQGERYGQLHITLDGETLASTPLVALQSIEQAGFFSRISDSVRRKIQSLIGSLNE